MTLALTRRGALGALASFVLPSALAVQGALAQAGVRFRDVQVDVSPLRASAGDPTADWVQRELRGALAQSLAGHIAPGDRAGATLVARLDYLYLMRERHHSPLVRFLVERLVDGAPIVRAIARRGLATTAPRGPFTMRTPLIVSCVEWRKPGPPEFGPSVRRLGAKGVGALTGWFLQAPIGRSS
jgi:hypothetical protein